MRHSVSRIFLSDLQSFKTNIVVSNPKTTVSSKECMKPDVYPFCVLIKNQKDDIHALRTLTDVLENPRANEHREYSTPGVRKSVKLIDFVPRTQGVSWNLIPGVDSAYMASNSFILTGNSNGISMD